MDFYAEFKKCVRAHQQHKKDTSFNCGTIKSSLYVAEGRDFKAQNLMQNVVFLLERKCFNKCWSSGPQEKKNPKYEKRMEIHDLYLGLHRSLHPEDIAAFIQTRRLLGKKSITCELCQWRTEGKGPPMFL